MMQTIVYSNRVFYPEVCYEMEEEEYENITMHVLEIFRERKEFKSCYQRNGQMDPSELWAIYSVHIESTNTLVTGGLG